MVQATMFEAKTRLSELVRKAQMGEKVVLTHGRDRVPVAEIVALEPMKKRPLGLFAVPGADIPADLGGELSDEELKLWEGGGE